MEQSTRSKLPPLLLSLLVITRLLVGCANPAAGMIQPVRTETAIFTDGVDPLLAGTPGAAPTAEAFSTQKPAPLETTANSTEPAAPRAWLSPALPKVFTEKLNLPQTGQIVTKYEDANWWVEIASQKAISSWSNRQVVSQATWFYALVSPFPTVEDGVSLGTLRKLWQGNLKQAPGNHPLLMSAETKAVLSSAWGTEQDWGPANAKGVQIVESDKLLDAAWEAQTAWAIIPFEAIEPRWKVLRVDGQSPLDQDFDAATYPLGIAITVSKTAGAAPVAPALKSLPTNRDPEKLTVLVMTGVTALSRHIAERMEDKGITYPANEIGDWLAEADLTHISNEVSFYTDCPKPGPERADMRFCSNPKYIELLEAVGTDIIELTGNHNLDWGTQPFLDSLEMYRQRGWGIYGGGATLDQSKEPLYIEHNGNRVVFLGCSPAGPAAVWATEYTPGSAPCNMARLEEQIRQLRSDGYLPVVTLQAIETDTYVPTPAQGSPDFRRMARAGAIIVSGSQSHVPQTMTFVQSPKNGYSFVHYGLGNLFFDQMEPERARQQWIDRHFIYDGRYLGVELLSALLEDSARPRPMTKSEREQFLETIFSLSQWSGD